MSIHHLSSRRVALAREARCGGWLTQMSALPTEPGALGLVWPDAPGPAEIAAMAGAALNRVGTGYLDPATVVLPWQDLAANLALGTDLPPDAPILGRMLAVAGLAGRRGARPGRMSPFDRLVLGLGRAMLHHPGLLVVSRLTRHPAAAGHLRELARVEAEFGHLTGCLRLHVVDRPLDCAAFCDHFLNVQP
jgi:hypothetical protein